MRRLYTFIKQSLHILQSNNMVQAILNILQSNDFFL